MDNYQLWTLIGAMNIARLNQENALLKQKINREKQELIKMLLIAHQNGHPTALEEARTIYAELNPPKLPLRIALGIILWLLHRLVTVAFILIYAIVVMVTHYYGLDILAIILMILFLPTLFLVVKRLRKIHRMLKSKVFKAIVFYRKDFTPLPYQY
jgi:Flp pilus assembly protein TadB